jgi:hypothetical protein
MSTRGFMRLSALFRKLRFSAPQRLRDENTPARTIAPVARHNFCLLIGGAGFSLPIRTQFGPYPLRSPLPPRPTRPNAQMPLPLPPCSSFSPRCSIRRSRRRSLSPRLSVSAMKTQPPLHCSRRPPKAVPKGCAPPSFMIYGLAVRPLVVHLCSSGADSVFLFTCGTLP